MGTLFTIGYEGAALSDFLASLKRAGIRCLIDVRELPISRRKGFSKNALADALEGEGIGYVHLRLLGDPKEGRMAARAGDYDRFRRLFLAHLGTDAAQMQLREAGEIAAREASCLLCYEREPEHCHRSLVAKDISQLFGLSVRHLGVVAGLATELGSGSRQGPCRNLKAA